MANGRNKLENRVDWRTIEVAPLENVVKQVSLADVWHCEEYDFTPWLAAHIDEINKLIGTDLSIIATEQSVGRYEVDVYAEDNNSGEKFIIENQFGQSDNTHVGKIAIYANNLKAKCRVWIGEKLLPEHIQYFEEENAHSENSYYAIEVNAYKINGKYYYKFEVVVKPDEPLTQLQKVMEMSEASRENYNMVQNYFNEFGKKSGYADKITFGSHDHGDRCIKVLNIPQIGFFTKVYKRDKYINFTVITHHKDINEAEITKFLEDNNITWLKKSYGVKNADWCIWSITKSFENDPMEIMDWAIETNEKIIKLFKNFKYNK